MKQTTKKMTKKLVEMDNLKSEILCKMYDTFGTSVK